jgi:hypothetical protein
MYHCPSNKFNVFGLNACGLDTSHMPVGSEASITFSVYDNSFPPNAAHENRTVRIVSPCRAGRGVIHCPNLAQPCGTSPCSFRSAILETDQAIGDGTKLSLHFHRGIATPAVSPPFLGTRLNVSWPCSAGPPLDLAICPNDTSSCFVHTESQPLAGVKLRVWTPISTSNHITEGCSVSSLSLGVCPRGNHTVNFQIFLGDREISDMATLNVSITTPIVSFAVNISLQVAVPQSTSLTAWTSLHDELKGSSSLSNPLLQGASTVTKLALLSSSCQIAAQGIDVDIRTHNAAVMAKPSAGFITVCITACALLFCWYFYISIHTFFHRFL